MRIIGNLRIPPPAIAVVLFLSACIEIAAATTYYVAPNGSDGNSGSHNLPFKTIQKAASVINPGDTVIVRNGVYTDTNGDNIIANLTRGGTVDNWVVFKAENKWGAVLDGQQNKTKYGWNFGSTANYVRIEDFEITGCGSGGAAFWSNQKAHHAYIYGNHIHHIGRDTYAGEWNSGGGGIYLGTGTSHYTFDSNVWHHIGRLPSGHPYDYNRDHAIYTHGNQTTIINNIFYSIEAGWSILIAGSAEGHQDYVISNNVFAGANPQRDGQLLVKERAENILIQNNIFYETRNSGITGSSAGPQKSVLVRNNLFSPNVVIALPYYPENWVIEDNNIEGQDPLFTNPASFDFHLQKSSPAIDVGASADCPELDIEGNNRPLGNGFEIGAYEFGEGKSLAAAIIASPDTGPAPLTVQFAANTSGGSPPYAYAWDFGDGASSAQQTTSHTFIQSGIFNVSLIVTDTLNSQTTASRSIEVSASLAPTPSVVNVVITPPGITQATSVIDRGEWYDLYMYFDGWDNISYADIWINHESSSEGSIANRGGRFFSTSNYKMSYSISNDQIWAGQTEGSTAGTNITGILGLYVDDDNDEYTQNRDAQWAKARFRLLDNALTGTWKMNAYVVSKNNETSSLVQKTVRLSSIADTIAPVPPQELKAVLNITH